MSLGVRSDDELTVGRQSALQRERLDLLAQFVLLDELVRVQPLARLLAVLGAYLDAVFLDHLHGDVLWRVDGAELDGQVQPTGAILVAEDRNSDLLLRRRLRRTGLRLARRFGCMRPVRRRGNAVRHLAEREAVLLRRRRRRRRRRRMAEQRRLDDEDAVDGEEGPQVHVVDLARFLNLARVLARRRDAVFVLLLAGCADDNARTVRGHADARRLEVSEVEAQLVASARIAPRFSTAARVRVLEKERLHLANVQHFRAAAEFRRRRHRRRVVPVVGRRRNVAVAKTAAGGGGGTSAVARMQRQEFFAHFLQFLFPVLAASLDVFLHSAFQLAHAHRLASFERLAVEMDRYGLNGGGGGGGGGARTAAAARCRFGRHFVVFSAVYLRRSVW